MKIAAIGDIHFHEHYAGTYKNIFSMIHEHADVLILCGDLTNSGLPREAEHLANDARSACIPILAVFGNHDCQNDKLPELRKIIGAGNVIFIDEEPFELDGVGFAGTKGFGGGFDTHVLSSFGESAIKHFVSEAVNESLALENALHSLKTPKRVVALHYSPIPGTVAGEPPELFPFLGCSRLGEAIDRFAVSAVFHGHAHHGTREGRTPKGAPVYNCAFELMRRQNPDRPFALVEI